MFAIALALVALFGGGAVVFFVMDKPRRDYQERLRALRTDEVELAHRIQANHDAERRCYEREQRLDQDLVAFQRRVREFETRTAEWNKQIISYDNLVTENGILKTDLKNLHTHMAHQRYQQMSQGEMQSAVTRAREIVAQAYVREVRTQVERDLTASNYPASKQRVQAAFDLVRQQGVSVPQVEINAALTSLHQRYEKVLRAIAEREHQAEIKERIRDEQRREREAQAARDAAAEAERQQQLLQRALDQARAEATNAAVGKHASEIERLQAELAKAKIEAEAKKERAISLAQITRSGFVYVISNLGSFGQGIYKIGLTRRLDPMDRVIELGDASVPFTFDVHMIITSDDAPKLEKALHRKFHTKRVNKVNLRKEFFRVSIDEIVAAVKEHHGDVDYKADAEALEFMQSQTMTEADLAEVEDAYEDAEEDVERASAPSDLR